MTDETNETATETAAPTPATVNKAKRSLPVKHILLTLLVALLAFAGGYLWRDHSAKQQDKKQAAEITSLKKDVADLKKTAAASSKAASTAKATPVAASVKPSAATIENIKASITSDNTAALEGYMAPTVKVIIAASEGIGDRTPTQAVNDLAYLDKATDPWDFNLPAATLTAWGSGSYASYFPADAVVGKAANNYVVSFTFNSSGKISGVFMAIDASSL